MSALFSRCNFLVNPVTWTNLIDEILQVGRLVPLSAKLLRREVRRVGFQEKLLDRDFSGKVSRFPLF